MTLSKTTYEQALRIDGRLADDHVLLFDGHSLAYRAYYGIRDLTTRAGLPVNAVFGFCRVLIKSLREHPSAYAAVVFDASGPTFRHEMYPEYKANRKPMPEDLAEQMPLLRRLLEVLGIPVLCVPGVEADDVLATLARHADESGLTCLIATSDKDMAQAVTERVSLLRPAGRGNADAYQRLDPPGVEAKYGVPPERIVDWLSLIGDTSDNVPGVPGVGEKTATKLLQTHESLETLFAHVEDIRNARVRTNLAENQDAALRARSLIRLRNDVELSDGLQQCRLTGIDAEALDAFLAEMEFETLRRELAIDRSPVPDAQELPPVDYRTVLDHKTLSAVIEQLQQADAASIDLETTSRDPMRARIVGIAVSPAPCIGYYIPVGHDSLDAPTQLRLPEVLEALRPLLEDESIPLIGQNLKYDMTILERNGLAPRGIVFDSMVASYVVHPDERRHNLEQIARTYLGMEMETYAEVAGKEGPFASVPVDRATHYAAEDAEVVQRLRKPLLEALETVNGTQLFSELEMPLVPVLSRMERAGVLVDPSVLQTQGEELSGLLKRNEADLFEMAGETFNPNSPKQVAEILFHRLGLPVIEKTKTGPSTSARVLSELAQHHALPGKLMEHRELKKLLSTYIEQLPEAIHPETGRIHTTFHQTSTATGRLSSSDPNLQNIPTRTEIGGRIRRAFVAPPGSVLVAADYSQIELRLLAHLSEDDRLIDAFQRGTDLHRGTAAHVFGLPEESVTDELRTAAKRINFGILYGISPFGLARDLGISRSEAKQYIDRFFDAYPKAKVAIDRMIETATKTGYAETLLGRRRPLPNLGSRNVQRRNFDQRNAVNTPIQGSAADLIKLAMLEIDQRILAGEIRATMILQIHDELIFEVRQEDVDTVAETVREVMEGIMTLRIPLEIKLKQGENWGVL